MNRVGVGGYWNLQDLQIGLPAGTVKLTWDNLTCRTLWTLVDPRLRLVVGS